MSEVLRRFAGALALTVCTAAAVVGFGLAGPEDTASVGLLVLCGLGLLALVRLVARTAPPVRRPLFERSLHRAPAQGSRPTAITRIEVDLAFGAESAAQLHARVLPLLRLLASGRLASRHGVDLERAPEAARALLGDDAWELVRPDRAAPRNVLAPGVPLRRLAETVTRLEEL